MMTLRYDFKKIAGVTKASTGWKTCNNCGKHFPTMHYESINGVKGEYCSNCNQDRDDRKPLKE